MSLIKTCLTTLIALCVQWLVSSPAWAYANVHFSKITYTDEVKANQLLISYHHAIFEVNKQEQYIIAQLTDKERATLSSHFSIVDATQWQSAFENKLGLKSLKLNHQVAKESVPGFACYPTVEETYAQGESLATQYPTLATWFDIGDSWMKANQQGGYDLMVLKITNQAVVSVKPKLFIHSSMHAREYTPAALNLDFAQWLLNDYSTNAEARWIVDNREVHLLFHMNPDGRKIAEQQVLQRKNTNQNHCAGSTVGVDLNRNFAQTWNVTPDGSSGDECDQTYRGVAPESEPETQAVSQYVRSLFTDERGENDNDAAPSNKSGLHLDLHSYGQLILWPWGHTSQSSPNSTGFTALGNKLAWFNDYTPQQSIGLYPTDGTSDSVSYGELGVANITFELGTSFFQGCTAYEQTIKPDNLNALIYAAKVAEAPYLLSQFPDIASVIVNNSLEQTTVTAGTAVELVIQGTTKQTKLSSASTDIALLEYVIDDTFSATNNVISLEQTTVLDGNGGAQASTQIDTTNLSVGQHIVSVRAKNAQGMAGVTHQVFINIADNNAPIPAIKVTCQHLACTFDGSDSRDSDGDISSYRWTFSNGESKEGITVEHTFARAGTEHVSLLIEDNTGLQASITETVTVTAIEVITVTPEKASSSGGTVWGLLVVLWSILGFRLTQLRRFSRAIDC